MSLVLAALAIAGLVLVAIIGIWHVPRSAPGRGHAPPFRNPPPLRAP